MNVADSAKLEDVLRAAGYSSVDNEEKADVLLINTCVVRQHAEDRAAWYITSAKGLKKDNPDLLIGICGCYVTEPDRDLKKQFPHVDWFIPPNSPETLADILSATRNFSPSLFKTLPAGRQGGVTGSEFVTIAHGCNNYCSYCVVPYVRGRETSRPMDEVLAEIKALIEQGATDITLLGQNVNSYKYGLATLLRNISSLVPSSQSPAPIFRFMTSHPKDMSDEIIETVAGLPYVAKEFHLPLQSGDNDILKRMNRGYTVEYFKDRIAKIRSLIPAARITSDMLVGFPGETEEQFNNSLKMTEELKFAAVNMFAYSARPETAAGKMEGQLPEEVKYARLQRLIEVVRAAVKNNIP
jgi:tRNA-2-methylthio-N6-dimethylallyladenosine synthase